MQRYFTSISSVSLLLALVACGGGGGGSTTPQTVATATPAPSVSGDMVAMQASRGWNYQTTYNNTDATITLYADPTNVGTGVTAMLGALMPGLVTTVATSATAMQTNAIGEIGFKIDGSKNYNVYSEASVGSTAVVPGSPLLVPSTLTLGQTWTPATGASASVISVGVVPGQSACPNATASTIGAEVEYTYPGYNDIVSYVPGCGITDLKNPTNGAEFTLKSVATYSSIGTLSRRAATATYLDTAASLLGQRRNNFPAAKLLNALLKKTCYKQEKRAARAALFSFICGATCRTSFPGTQ